MNLYSYVVRYDSGFAPNPFYRYCTLATCKPTIRKYAQIGDWIVGSGSAEKKKKQDGKLVYAMRVTEALSHNEYYDDSRFQRKKPILTGSRKQARGDNIYHFANNQWTQHDSFHSNPGGEQNEEHTYRDTRVDRILVSDNFIYFGSNGPLIPEELVSSGKPLLHSGVGYRKFIGSNTDDAELIKGFEVWLQSLDAEGFVSNPYDWNEKVQ